MSRGTSASQRVGRRNRDRGGDEAIVIATITRPHSAMLRPTSRCTGGDNEKDRSGETYGMARQVAGEKCLWGLGLVVLD